MRHIWLILALVFAGFAPAAIAGNVRQIMPLDDGWRFDRADVPDAEQSAFDDGAWQAISLPHSHNATDGDDGGGNYYRGPAWYRRIVTFTPQPPRRTFIEFDGAALAADVWLNGIKVGRHEGGYARFRFDVTPYLRAGRNVLAVRVDNSALPDVTPLGGDFTVFGGIYRRVRLVTTDDVHIDMLDDGGPGAYVNTSHVNAQSVDVNWTVRVANDSDSPENAQVVEHLYDAQNHIVRTLTKTVSLTAHAVEPVTLAGQLDKPHLWQGVDDPYLYRGDIDIVSGGHTLDHIEIPVGIRDIHIDPNKGLLLNGKPYAIHGVDIHQSMRPGIGPAVSDAQIDEDFAMLGDLGVTGLRFAHYQHPQHDYDLADRKGYVVWAELPLNSKVVATGAFADNATQQLRELIRQNANHPSIITWSIGNEIYNTDPDSDHLLDQMQAIAHEEDPSRPTTYANCCSPVNGPHASHTDVIAYNTYFGWYSGEMGDLKPFLANAHALRPTTPIAISEYGAGASILQQEDPPKRPQTAGRWHPEQYQALYHEAAWRQIRDTPYLWASFIWVGFDFPSDGRSEGDRLGINDKGLITYDRKVKKDAYFWYQANWTTKPMLYITSRRDVTRTAAVADVKVYSNQTTADLKLNGADLGAVPVDDHIAIWHVTLKPGRNHIEAASGDVHDAVDWTLKLKVSP